jgi:hypothetical protein
LLISLSYTKSFSLALSLALYPSSAEVVSLVREKDRGLFSFGEKSVLHPLSSVTRKPTSGGVFEMSIFLVGERKTCPVLLDSYLTSRIVIRILPESFPEEFWILPHPL